MTSIEPPAHHPILSDTPAADASTVAGRHLGSFDPGLESIRPKAEDRPTLDEDGLLRHGGRWVAISDAQLPVVRLLIVRFGRLVRENDLLLAYAEAGCRATPASMRSLIHRVGRRVTELDLELRSVRGRGVVLDVADGPSPR